MSLLFFVWLREWETLFLDSVCLLATLGIYRSLSVANEECNTLCLKLLGLRDSV